ncbi:auxin-induced protein 22D-like [Argentina anserina]|uniref:auxin-induced protein 22D-like n=1 Tax=Argentina anserina TaxID=57926 RepID=UPI002176860E|nr:auxin-induced protein 22D-like [Potentilla anserina]
MEGSVSYENHDEQLNFKETELTLGLPGSGKEELAATSPLPTKKRASPEQEPADEECRSSTTDDETSRPSKTQVVGWPPIRSYRKNAMQAYVKVSVDGAPYLRKIDITVYKSYSELLKALEDMFKLTIGSYSEREGYNGSEFAPTYQDKDGDWMLVGDVPWNMFASSCKRLRIMKGSEARGLACL